ncbi:MULTISPECIES: RNase P modulator RnpM [unclassified Butyrivibrio]|uniref:RNase P modulator RnpM n=1 Tax=unclassified Butyrivibrio TaxID=2639466 RepID=UPI00040594BB|nr:MULTISPECIES: YlxR family protein [unclassified Butyrivibrio]
MNKPMRRCVGCGESREKKELIRIIRDTDGNIRLDLTGRANGRGAYICRDEKCLEMAIKKKGLDRTLKVAVPPEIADELKKELAENE